MRIPFHNSLRSLQYKAANIPIYHPDPPYRRVGDRLVECPLRNLCLPVSQLVLRGYVVVLSLYS